MIAIKSLSLSLSSLLTSCRFCYCCCHHRCWLLLLLLLLLPLLLLLLLLCYWASLSHFNDSLSFPQTSSSTTTKTRLSTPLWRAVHLTNWVGPFPPWGTPWVGLCTTSLPSVAWHVAQEYPWRFALRQPQDHSLKIGSLKMGSLGCMLRHACFAIRFLELKSGSFTLPACVSCHLRGDNTK